MTSLSLESIRRPEDIRDLTSGDQAALCAEIRRFLIDRVARTGGHLGPNLGVVELTVVLHVVFDSPYEPILFDVGHQTYVHKILTGRAPASIGCARPTASPAIRAAPRVRTTGSRTRTQRVGPGQAGCVGQHLAGLRMRPGYERVLDGFKRVTQTPFVGRPVYAALRGLERGAKDMLAPQGLFEDLGLKYLGPVDGHDLAALQRSLTMAKSFGGPVIVHAVTHKGHGYPPAENDDVEQMHAPGAFDPTTGRQLPKGGQRWTSVFSDEIVAIGAERPDVVTITAAMWSRPDWARARGAFRSAPTTSALPSRTR